MPQLEYLNTCLRDVFVSALGDVFEHSPWVAEAAFPFRPFPTVAALHNAMMEAVRTAPPGRQFEFVRGHPELASKVGPGDLTAASRAEQGSLGLDRLSGEEFTRFTRLNAEYRKRFDLPFVICVRRHTRDSILRNFERRTANDPEMELRNALDEIGLITRLRLVATVDGPGKPTTDGWLSTHVLDTMDGKPAAGVRPDRADDHQCGRTHRSAAIVGWATAHRHLRVAVLRRPLLRAPCHGRAALSRYRTGPLLHRGAREPLSRATSGDAVELFYLSGKLSPP
jgi:OHCU decarboxylase